jgi:uncharacterized membrane protein SpoIIM required for sporulation
MSDNRFRKALTIWLYIVGVILSSFWAYICPQGAFEVALILISLVGVLITGYIVFYVPPLLWVKFTGGEDE